MRIQSHTVQYGFHLRSEKKSEKVRLLSSVIWNIIFLSERSRLSLDQSPMDLECSKTVRIGTLSAHMPFLFNFTRRKIQIAPESDLERDNREAFWTISIWFMSWLNIICFYKFTASNCMITIRLFDILITGLNRTTVKALNVSCIF